CAKKRAKQESPDQEKAREARRRVQHWTTPFPAILDIASRWSLATKTARFEVPPCEGGTCGRGRRSPQSPNGRDRQPRSCEGGPLLGGRGLRRAHPAGVRGFPPPGRPPGRTRLGGGTREG